MQPLFPKFISKYKNIVDYIILCVSRNRKITWSVTAALVVYLFVFGLTIQPIPIIVILLIIFILVKRGSNTNLSQGKTHSTGTSVAVVENKKRGLFEILIGIFIILLVIPGVIAFLLFVYYSLLGYTNY